MRIRDLLYTVVVAALLPATSSIGSGKTGPGQDEMDVQSRRALDQAVEALGGRAYLGARTTYSEGNWFGFDKHGRRSPLVKFREWLQFDPLKWHFQRGKGKRQLVSVYNLELNKAWRQEGKDHVEDVDPKDVEEFRKGAKHDIDIILKHRTRGQEELKMFYFGPDEITGSGELEAVEILDSSNDSVILFFNRDDHLPHHIEYQTTDKDGNHFKMSEEYYNWHTFGGVRVSLRKDSLRDGKLIRQRHLTLVTVNPAIPESQFLEPVVEEKKKKEKKKE